MITHHRVTQGTPDWHALRCGLLTASELHHIITPATLKAARNDKSRAHMYELLAQRITNFVEPHFESYDMQRGHADEVRAREVYGEYARRTVSTEVGFITNDRWGFVMGYSPDGLVEAHNLDAPGQIEIKSRKQKYQVETVLAQAVPTEHIIQVQAGLLISERAWCDFISYSGGMPLVLLRVYPDEPLQGAILGAAVSFEQQARAEMARYMDIVKKNNWPATERAEELPVV